MFGYHKAKREKKKAKREREDLNRERAFLEGQKPELERQHQEAQKVQLAEKTQEAKTSRQQAREEGKKYAEEVLGRDVQGLTPAQRNAMQFEANKQIQRQHQSANRKLLGDQGQHGIVGKGGVGFAQQKDLQRLANESQGQATRDIDKLNADLALKKLAAMFNIEQGEVAQNQLDKQMAVDELKLSDEQKRQRYFEDQFNRLFSRL
jgi:hypothetical protein